MVFFFFAVRGSTKVLDSVISHLWLDLLEIENSGF
jgi:hypothetical protein